MTYPYYNSYTPYIYGYQQPQMVQPNVQQGPTMQTQQTVAPAPQPVQQTSNPSTIIWVRNNQDAAMYPVAPNNAVALWDSSTPVIYLKQADASGKPSMKTYDLVERTEQPADTQKSETGRDTPYAMKEDVAALAGIVKGFDGMIASIKGDIEKMSGDLYGLAGSKKKSTKKAESEEETE